MNRPKRYTTELARRVDEAVGRMRPILSALADQPPLVGAVLSEMTAIWIASHDPALEKALLSLQKDAVVAMLPALRAEAARLRASAEEAADGKAN